MFRKIRQGVVCGFALALAWHAAPVGAQDQATDTGEQPAVDSVQAAPEPGLVSPFAEEVDVTVVNVEVRVRDKDGNPVRGLTREDFQLFEDGRPVTITNFYAVEGGFKQTPGTVVAPTSASGEAPAADLEADPPLHMVIYIDNFNIRPYNRNRVFRQLREFIDVQLDDDDVTMLVSYDRTLHVRSPFSTNRSELLAKLTELERFTGHAVTLDADRRQVMRDIDEAISETHAILAAETFAESVYSDLRFSIRALHDFVDQLAGVGGRRAILHVSDGIPIRAGESVFYALERKYSTASVQLTALNYDATRDFRSLASAAAANDISFYMLDAAGLRAPSGVAMQSMTGAGGGAMVDSVYIRNHQQSLRLLADETGGLAILNTNNPGPGLENMRIDLDDYYSLGYSPAGTVAGRGHRLKLEVPALRKGTVRYRRSYREQTVDEKMEDQTLAALRFGLKDNSFGASLQVAEVRSRDDGLFDVSAWLRIPVSQLTLIPGEETYRGRVTLYVSALDEEGGVSDVANLDVPIELPSEEMPTLQDLEFPYRLELRMRPGPHRVAVGIRDVLGSRSSHLSQEFSVGAVE